MIAFHPEDLRALKELAEDKSSTLQELLDEAVRDLLKKHNKPTTLREALENSATVTDIDEKRRDKAKSKSGNSRSSS